MGDGRSAVGGGATVNLSPAQIGAPRGPVKDFDSSLNRLVRKVTKGVCEEP